MGLIRRIFTRLNAEYVWAKLGFYTWFVYNKRSPQIKFEPQIRGGAI